MFRGETLVDAGEAEWIRPHRARLVEVHEQLIEDTMAARLEMGAAAELIGELEALVQLPSAARADSRPADVGPVPGRSPGRRAARLSSRADGARRRARPRAGPRTSASRGGDPCPRPGPRPARATGWRDTACTPTVETGNLPAAVSSFVGRTRELGELSSLVATRRLITLVGPGGAGKTRLALEVGEQARTDFADGVWFIEFAPLKSGSDVDCCGRHGTRSR